MGFLFIIPFAALATWSIVKIFLRLRRGNYDYQWWKAFWILTLAGLALGTWLAFFSRYKVANSRMEGFPIPTVVFSREKPDGPWLQSTMPHPVRVGGAVTNLLCGVALCLIPIAITSFLKENRSRQETPGQTPVEPR